MGGVRKSFGMMQTVCSENHNVYSIQRVVNQAIVSSVMTNVSALISTPHVLEYVCNVDKMSGEQHTCYKIMQVCKCNLYTLVQS